MNLSKAEIDRFLSFVKSPERISFLVPELISYNRRKNMGTGNGGSIVIIFRKPLYVNDKPYFIESRGYLVGKYNKFYSPEKDFQEFLYTGSFSISKEAEISLKKWGTITSALPILHDVSYMDTTDEESERNFNKSYTEELIACKSPLRGEGNHKDEIGFLRDRKNRIVFYKIIEPSIWTGDSTTYRVCYKVKFMTKPLLLTQDQKSLFKWGSDKKDQELWLLYEQNKIK